ncbi:LemA family protein [Sphingomonas flavalba]|uniref:LemA family protein n=1 Tax=Sphingomonas flavalba TaxID=2559804 RepID=UPI0039E0F647
MPAQSFGEATDLPGRLIRATNFALDHWWLWLLAGLLLWLALRLRGQHALIARLDERADAAFADVDALLVERHGLIGNLVAVVRAFAEREHAVIRDVLDARIDAVEAMSDAAIHTDTQIANVLQNLFSVSENYPSLAAAGHYARLRDDLIRVEDRITAARKFYNLAVEELNAVRRAFPGNLLARRDAPVREKFSLGDRRAKMAESRQISF